MQAMMQMVKLDIKTLKLAYHAKVTPNKTTKS